MSSDLVADPGRTARSVRKSGPLLGVRVFRVVLWLVVVSGPVLAVLAMAGVSDLAGRVDVLGQTAAEPPSDTGLVEGFAELILAARLTGDSGSSMSGSPDGGWLVVRTVSLGAERIGVGHYAVTVAANLLPPNVEPPEGPVAEAADTLFYRVGVLETDSGLAVVGPPALIPPPHVGLVPDLLVDRMDGLDAGLEGATVRFLAAYLTGEGELARYTAPGSQLAPVLPSPFVSVEILEAGSVSVGDTAREVVVMVEGVDESGRGQVLQFGLMVAERDGRWEVTELLSTPTLADSKRANERSSG